MGAPRILGVPTGAASGATRASPLFPGTFVSVDAGGNVYALTDSGVVEYSAESAARMRTLSLVPGTEVQDMMASPSGEIYVSDGVGIAVFNSKATGSAPPDRYIQGISKSSDGTITKIVPGIITVDASNNLYVQDVASGSIVIFKPTDSGTVEPVRTIFGPSTLIDQRPYSIQGLATDAAGNLYVSALEKVFGVLVFDAAADGNVAPSRIITADQSVDMYPYFGNLGVAVDSGGTVYLSAVHRSNDVPAVFEFAPGASGPSVPYVVTVAAWGGDSSPPSRIAVH
jgi:hypothetical protein